MFYHILIDHPEGFIFKNWVCVPKLIGFLFTFFSDEEELRKSFSELGDNREDTNSRGMKCTGTGIVPSSSALPYKTGFLVRKVHADCDGKRSMFHYSLFLSTQVQGAVCRAKIVEYGAAGYQ